MQTKGIGHFQANGFCSIRGVVAAKPHELPPDAVVAAFFFDEK
jgi:hypothetical protein